MENMKSKKYFLTDRLIEKLKKAIMIVRKCRPLALAARKHRKSRLCLCCADLGMPPGSGGAFHVLHT